GSLAPGTYFYVVTASLLSGESPASAEVSATVVEHGTDKGKIHLSWNPVAGAIGYRVYRGTTAGGESVFFPVAAAVTTFTDTGGAGTPGAPPAALAGGSQTTEQIA